MLDKTYFLGMAAYEVICGLTLRQAVSVSVKCTELFPFFYLSVFIFAFLPLFVFFLSFARLFTYFYAIYYYYCYFHNSFFLSSNKFVANKIDTTR
ncbi:Uncharacterized protein TCM_042110 [Theobroma cacao]|uniref:Uncharacterized protein n=1 Tax=Theobroma cacao TaxID=3641 RepID=A0A061H0A2_THECC|nr:Uncharacterized protein TCM_042110 [Theobroma cacao]